MDSSILFDVLLDDSKFYGSSTAALSQAHAEGSVIACEAVWAEIAARFAQPADAERVFQELRVEYRPLDLQAAIASGAGWRAYRQAGGPRERVLPDFLIAAHALHHADRLLTRDRGFYQRYFSELRLFDPLA